VAPVECLPALLRTRERVRKEALLRRRMRMEKPGADEFYPGRDKMQATCVFLHTLRWSLDILLVSASSPDKRCDSHAAVAAASQSTAPTPT
jgi:hypothetical protein